MQFSTIIVAAFATLAAAWPDNFSPNCTTSTTVSAKGHASCAAPYIIEYPAVCADDTTVDTTCYVGLEHRTDAAKALQIHLDACYGKTLEIDGYFGPLTEAALKEVQTVLGFTGTDIDGIWGPLTGARMNYHAISHLGSDCLQASV